MKDEEPIVVVNSLRERLVAFKQNVRLIHALRNPGLRDRHWRQISSIAKRTVKRTEEMVLNDLLALNLQEHVAAVDEIPLDASKESRLEKMLEKMHVS